MAETLRTGDVRMEVTARPYARLVAEFYSEYARAFVLPNERESLAGFRKCLSLNGLPGEKLHRRFGPSREYIGVLRAASGEIAAGMNFICFPMPAFGDLMTIHSIYVFIVPAWRGHGLLRRIYRGMEQVARDFGAGHGLSPHAALIFIGEQNDPFRMTLDAFRQDTGLTGLNQFDRLAIWGRLGARVLAFPYVQPALSSHTAPDETLLLRVLYPTETASASDFFDPRVLREHLRRFIGITVLKGRCDPDTLPEVAAQMGILEDAIAAARPILAYPMAAEPVLTQWKARVSAILGDPMCGGSTTIGSRLEIASVLDICRPR